jgi:probable rRNA maturation factor
MARSKSTNHGSRITDHRVTRVEISGSVPRFTRRETSAFVRKVLQTLVKLGRMSQRISEVSVAFVDDDTMKRLNRRFRKRNRTTDVLTFPADSSYADPASAGRPLGDIVISIDQARRQAVAEKHPLATEVRYLILHGILHALGYDHEFDDGEMNALELVVRQAVGLE